MVLLMLCSKISTKDSELNMQLVSCLRMDIWKTYFSVRVYIGHLSWVVGDMAFCLIRDLRICSVNMKSKVCFFIYICPNNFDFSVLQGLADIILSLTFCAGCCIFWFEIF